MKKIILLGLIAAITFFSAGSVLGYECPDGATEIQVNQNENYGPTWNILGTFELEDPIVPTDPLTVTLSRVSGWVSADAVRFVNFTTGEQLIVDNESGGFSKTGTWSKHNVTNGWDSTACSGNGCFSVNKKESEKSNTTGATATWTVSSLPAGTYDFYASWTKVNGDGPYCLEGYDTIVELPKINASAGDYGEINPEGLGSVESDGSKTFTMTPDSGYYITDVLVDGESVKFDGDANVEGQYTFMNVTKEHSTIKVLFDDHASSYESATPIACAENKPGTFDFEGDGDYFKLNIPEPDSKKVRIYTSSVKVDGKSINSDTYGYLFKDDCSSVLASDDDSGSGRHFKIERVLKPGDYFIKVKHAAAKARGAYQLNVKCSNPPTTKFKITVTEGANGKIGVEGDYYTIDDDGNLSPDVAYGDSVTFKITPDSSVTPTYCIKDVITTTMDGDDSTNHGVIASYTFDYVTHDWNIMAIFIECTAGDNDGDGYTIDGGDCNDSDAAINPGATEKCGDGIDNDCVGGDLDCSLLTGCIDISDVPLNVQITSAPPLLMFLLDDSGSMDWSMIVKNEDGGSSQGTYDQWYYMFDDPHNDHGGKSIVETDRKFWKLQWSGMNYMYYNPHATYLPWPATDTYTMGPADMDTPLSDPTKAGTSFDITDEDGRDGMSATYCTLVELGGQRVTVKRSLNDAGVKDKKRTGTDAIAIVPVDKWEDGVAIENQKDKIIIDDADYLYQKKGALKLIGDYWTVQWMSSSYDAYYKSDVLKHRRTAQYTTNNGDEATWLIDNVEEGNYYVFVNVQKKRKRSDGVWGKWETIDSEWTWVRNIDETLLALQAPYTVYDTDVDGNIQTTDVKLDQSQGKPDIPKFDNDPNDVDLSDADEISTWNTAWKAYWKQHWNGGRYYGVEGNEALKDREDSGWPADDSSLITKHPDYWNGKDWIPLGTPAGDEPGKQFKFINQVRKKHSIPNSHYYVKANDGKVWLVELIEDTSAEGGHIDYYLFEDGSYLDEDGNPLGDTDYVDYGEITQKTADADIPEEIRTYQDGKDKKSLTYAWARQNYTNWYQYYRRRELTAKAALGAVINNANGLMMGLDTFSVYNSDEGYWQKPRVSQPVLPIGVAGMADQRFDLLDVLYPLRSSGSTPLRQGLTRIGQYYSAVDGKEPLGLEVEDGVDDSPFWGKEDAGACQHAFVIAMTDGYYNGATLELPDPNADGDNPPYNDEWSYTLADVAMHYYETDLVEDDVLPDWVPVRDNDNASHQHMVTYTIAFGVTGFLDPDNYPSDALPDCPPACEWGKPSTNKYKIDDLWHAALNGRGAFMSAGNSQELIAALDDMVSSMEDSSGSGASVSTNTGQLQQDAVLFQGLFKSEGWAGDVVAYDIDTTTGEIIYDPIKWSAAAQLADPAKDTTDLQADWRKIFTLDGANGAPFRIKDTDEAHTLGLSEKLQKLLHATDKEKAEDILNYIRGDHSKEQAKGGLYRDRPPLEVDGVILSRLGDIVHSETMNVRYDGADKDSAADDFSVLYVGSNDGMLHAFDSKTGDELFAYIPNLVLDNTDDTARSNLTRLTRPDYDHFYFVDGDNYVADISADANDPKLLFAGALRKGGKGVYCLNITNPKVDTEADAASSIANWEYPVKYDSGGNEIIGAGFLRYTFVGVSGGKHFEINEAVTSNGVTAKVGRVDTDKLTMMLYNIKKNSEDNYFEEEQLITGGTGGGKAKVVGNLQATEPDAMMGYSFSKAFIVNSDAGWVVLFGNGYQSLRGHAVLYAILLDSDGKIKDDGVYRIDTNPTGIGDDDPDTRECNGLSTPALVDDDLDGKVDYAYAGDLTGKLWKFDLNGDEPEKWKVAYYKETDTDDIPQPLFHAVNADGENQPITTKPDVITPCLEDQSGNFVVFGTGRYLGADDFDNTSVQSVYAIWDWQEELEEVYAADADGGTTDETAATMYFGNLVKDASVAPANCTGEPDSRAFSNQTDVRLLKQTSTKKTVLVEVDDGDGGTVEQEITFEVMSDNKISWYSPETGEGCHVGWYFDLPIEGERITSDPVLRDGVAYFTSTTPINTPCVAGGETILWGMEACSGSRFTLPLFDINDDGVIDSADQINIGTVDNPVMVAPTGLNFSSYLYSPGFISVSGGDAMALLGGMTKKIKTLRTTAGGYGVYYWKERD